MTSRSVQRLTGTRIPTREGEFTLSLYQNNLDEKDHLALLHGDVGGADDVLVRIHSECFTGDVLGSLRCDCGAQLDAALQKIAEEGRGVLLYLRQEGRGIGLLDKLRAYDLQDEGYDTVEANRMLGHEADERDYSIGALILDDLGVSSVRLLTNNPEKIESLEQHGVSVQERVPLGPHVNRHNEDYLRTKVDRMRHMLDLGSANGAATAGSPASTTVDIAGLQKEAHQFSREHAVPFVTLTYAQSLDGSIAQAGGTPMQLSGERSLEMTHQLRAAHDSILVGIGTVLADDPRLTVRRGEGEHPRPVVLDSSLRLPLSARLLTGDAPAPIVCTAPDPDPERRQALEAAGATVEIITAGAEPEESACDEGENAPGLPLAAVLRRLAERGLRSVMVEGGRAVLTSFFQERIGNKVIVTIAPEFVGGVTALEGPLERGSHLEQVQYNMIGDDLVVEGTPSWATSC